MKKVLAVFFLMFTVSLAEVNWFSLNEGLKKAKKEKKLVVIYITSKHCQYCKKMDKTTFEAKEIQNYMNIHFIPIKVEKSSKDGLLVRKMYGYMGTPTFHFLEPSGKKIKTLFGAWKTDEFMKILRYFAEGHYKTESMTEYFMKN